MDTSVLEATFTNQLPYGDDCILFSARKRGRKHVNKGIPCQDYCLTRVISEHLAVTTVADGHGGDAYTLSDRGSKIACETLIDLIETMNSNLQQWTDASELMFINTLKSKAFKHHFVSAWREAVTNDYYQLNIENDINSHQIIQKYGTTILFAVATSHYFTLGQLGDGAIWLFNNTTGSGQLFKRHAPKIGEETNSLCSGQSYLALLIDIFPRSVFGNVLLSTDGMYDRLANFGQYAETLYCKVFQFSDVSNPFHFNDIDVSSITDDDCTIALIGTTKAHNSEDFHALIEQGFSDILLDRIWSKVSVYTAQKNEKSYEIHLLSSAQSVNIQIPDLPCIVHRAICCISLDDKTKAFIYEKNDDVTFSFLHESGETLEKRYTADPVVENEVFYSNQIWLEIYERIKLIQDKLEVVGLTLRDDFFYQMRIYGSGEIALFDNMIINRIAISDYQPTKIFRETLGIIGKIMYGESETPIYECLVQGQAIPHLHMNSTTAMCRCRYKCNQQSFGLQNVSEQTWTVVDPGKRPMEIPPRGILKLSSNHTIWIQNDCAEANSNPQEENDTLRYDVVVF